MKKNIKFLFLPVMLLFFITSCDKKDSGFEKNLIPKNQAAAFINVSDIDCAELPVDLIAGQHTKVGTVDVERDGTKLRVRYMTNEPYILTEIHVDVRTDPNDFPMTNTGNPKIGNFEFITTFSSLENQTNYLTNEFTIPASGSVYIAAHAVVCNTDKITGYKETDMNTICDLLPPSGKLNLTQNFTLGVLGYTLAEISGGTSIDGIYPGWCIDPKADISGMTYDVDFICSLGDLSRFTGIIKYPENMDLVNYILNQKYYGKEMVEGMGAVTNGDIQKAIWILTDGNPDQTAGITDGFDIDRVNWIVAQAVNYGENFRPSCGGYMAVILYPTGPAGSVPAQLTIISIPVPCEPIYSCETAWGKGFGFPGSSWAMFFKYCY